MESVPVNEISESEDITSDSHASMVKEETELCGKHSINGFPCPSVDHEERIKKRALTTETNILHYGIHDVPPRFMSFLFGLQVSLDKGLKTGGFVSGVTLSFGLY